MSTLYHHIIVKYFHIEDEMQFKERTSQNTMTAPPQKKKNKQKTQKTKQIKSKCIGGSKENKKNSNHDK